MRRLVSARGRNAGAVWGVLLLLLLGGTALVMVKGRHTEVRRMTLASLLVTGDSTAVVLDQALAQRLLAAGVAVTGDTRDGMSVARSSGFGVMNLLTYSRRQEVQPADGAVVAMVGNDEGGKIRGTSASPALPCCGLGWAYRYANRVGKIMDRYTRNGARVYWLTVPAQRGEWRRRMVGAVNRAIRTAAGPRRSLVRVIETGTVISPKDVYRNRIVVDGAATAIHEADGVHLNDAGSDLVASVVIDLLAKDFDLRGAEGRVAAE